jgi:hypothetical protein
MVEAYYPLATSQSHFTVQVQDYKESLEAKNFLKGELLFAYSTFLLNYLAFLEYFKMFTVQITCTVIYSLL